MRCAVYSDIKDNKVTTPEVDVRLSQLRCNYAPAASQLHLVHLGETLKHLDYLQGGASW